MSLHKGLSNSLMKTEGTVTLRLGGIILIACMMEY
jgi:hypothetical protein